MKILLEKLRKKLTPQTPKITTHQQKQKSNQLDER